MAGSILQIIDTSRRMWQCILYPVSPHLHPSVGLTSFSPVVLASCMETCTYLIKRIEAESRCLAYLTAGCCNRHYCPKRRPWVFAWMVTTCGALENRSVGDQRLMAPSTPNLTPKQFACTFSKSFALRFGRPDVVTSPRSKQAHSRNPRLASASQSQPGVGAAFGAIKFPTNDI